MWIILSVKENECILACVIAGGLHALASYVPAGQSKKQLGLGRHLLSDCCVHGWTSISEAPHCDLHGRH
jgi:hypothetical protein